jgi:hypothetical protein
MSSYKVGIVLVVAVTITTNQILLRQSQVRREEPKDMGMKESESLGEGLMSNDREKGAEKEAKVRRVVVLCLERERDFFESTGV